LPRRPAREGTGGTTGRAKEDSRKTEDERVVEGNNSRQGLEEITERAGEDARADSEVRPGRPTKGRLHGREREEGEAERTQIRSQRNKAPSAEQRGKGAEEGGYRSRGARNPGRDGGQKEGSRTTRAVGQRARKGAKREIGPTREEDWISALCAHGAHIGKTAAGRSRM